MLALALALLACADSAAPPAAATTPAAPTASATTGAAAPAAAVRTVGVATLKADLDRGAVPLLVDVRTPAEYAGGHVPGAKNVPLDELDARLPELGAAGEVYVICEVGGRSAKAATLLAGKGRAAVNVAGGTSAWRAAGFGVE